MRYKKIIIGIGIFFIVLVLGNVVLNFWIAKQLPALINAKNKSAYHVSYGKLTISLLNNTLHVDKVIVIPKNALKKSKDKSGIYAKITSIDVDGFGFWSLLFTDKIKAQSLTLTKPEIVLYKKNERVVNDARSVRSQVVKPFERIILVSDIFVKNGDLKIINVLNNRAVLNASNINLKLDHITINQKIMAEKIPFKYKTYSFNCDSLYYRAGPFYHIRTKKIVTTDKGMSVKSFELIPEYGRREFVKRLKTEKDLFTVNAQDISVRDMEWGYKKNILFFNAHAVALDRVSADVYRNKIPSDDLRKKYLYNKLLRDLDFNLKIDTLSLRHSVLEYEEELAFEKGAGKLTFGKLNLTALHIQSGLGKKTLPDVNINVDCDFMNTAPLNVDWTLHMMDKNDGFTIKGEILNFDTKKITPFAKPYMNLTTEGVLNNVYFTLVGDDDAVKGKFAIKYEDLKVTVYQSGNRKKKNKLLTSIGNLFVKNDTKGKIKSTDVELKRIQEKSFYNLLWRSVAKGLRKILL